MGYGVWSYKGRLSYPDVEETCPLVTAWAEGLISHDSNYEC